MKGKTEFATDQILPARSESILVTSKRPSIFLIIHVLYGLCQFDLFGFRRQFAPMRRFIEQTKTAQEEPPSGSVEQVCEAVNQAIVFYPRRVLCLQRAVVTTALLRSMGVAAQLVVGAQGVPFKAHAWTEVNGSPVNEYRDVRKLYQEMDRF